MMKLYSTVILYSKPEKTAQILDLFTSIEPPASTRYLYDCIHDVVPVWLLCDKSDASNIYNDIANALSARSESKTPLKIEIDVSNYVSHDGVLIIVTRYQDVGFNPRFIQISQYENS